MHDKEQCLKMDYRNSAEWQLIDDLVHLRKVTLWLPGSTSAWFVGFGNLIPLGSWIVSIVAAYADYPPGAHLFIPHVISITFILLHGAVMLCMMLGFKFGQRLVIAYLVLAAVISLMFYLYSLYASQPIAVNWITAAGFVVTAFMVWVAQAKSFTTYAEIMRVKRIYFRERREYLAELAGERKRLLKKIYKK